MKIKKRDKSINSNASKREDIYFFFGKIVICQNRNKKNKIKKSNKRKKWTRMKVFFL